MAGLLYFDGFEVERDFSALVGPAFDANLRSVCVEDTFDDGQPEPGSAAVSGGGTSGLGESLEQVRLERTKTWHTSC